MKLLGLAAFTAYFAFLLWLWLRHWQDGWISRGPAFADVYRDKSPRKFKFWTVIHSAVFATMTGLLVLAWWALFTGNLH